MDVIVNQESSKDNIENLMLSKQEILNIIIRYKK